MTPKHTAVLNPCGMHPRIKPHPGKNTNPYFNAIVGLAHTDTGGTKSLVEEDKVLNRNPTTGC